MEIDKEGREAKTIRELLNLSGQRILEVGCGKGRLTQILKAEDNFVLAIEPDVEKIKTAERVVPTAEFLVATIDDLNPCAEKLFDVIVFSLSLHHIGFSEEEKRIALHKAKTLLKPRGKILVIEPMRNSAVTSIVNSFYPEETMLLEQAIMAMNSFLGHTTGYFFFADLAWRYDTREELIFHFTKLLGASQSNSMWKKLLDNLQLPEKDITLIDKVSFVLME
jgi:ubiquinone/menaquinone biosynthesis C-methylase UbiE